MTKTTNNFFKDWQGLQASLGKLKKDTKNPFFKSKYVPLNQVLEVVKKECAKHNFIFMQTPVMFQGQPSLQTIVRHIGGELIEGNIPLVAKDPNDPQKIGGALTYMRRYSLVCMFNLEDEDDDGNKSSQPAKAVKVKFDSNNPNHLAIIKGEVYNLIQI